MLSNFLADISQQQLWLSPECLSVSSLEVGSEYGDDDDSHGSYTTGSEDNGSGSRSCSCSSSNSSSSSSSSEEEEPQAPRRYSRQERVKRQHQQQSQQYPQQHIEHKYCLRKAGASSPDLIRPRTSSFGGLVSPKSSPKKAATTNNKGAANSRWAASSGAKKAGWNLLNDNRIGTTTSKRTTNGNLAGLTSLGVQTHVLDVSIKQSNPRNDPTTKSTSLSTTLNVTTLSISIETETETESTTVKTKSSTPNLSGFRRSNTGPAPLKPRNYVGERRARRRNKSAGDSDSSPSHAFGSKPAFRRCISDPTSLIPHLKNDRWSSTPSASDGSSGRVRFDTTKKSVARPEIMTRTLLSQNDNQCRQSAPKMMDMPKKKGLDDPVQPLAGANARWSANPGRRPANSQLSDLRPKVPRASAPNLVTLGNSSAVSELGETSQFSMIGANARWSSSSPFQARSLQPQSQSSLINGGASAPHLLDLLNQRRPASRPAAEATTIDKVNMDIQPKGQSLSGSPSSIQMRPGVQRTTSRMVGRSKLTNASAPNLLNTRRSASVPKPHGSVNAQWGAARPMLGNGATPRLGRGLGRTPSCRPGVQRTVGQMCKGNMIGASAPNFMNLNLKQTPGNQQREGGGVNAQWRASNGQQLGGGMTRSPSSVARRPGVQRTDNRMVSNSVGASAPNLMNLQISSGGQQTGRVNAQWGAARQSPTQRLRSGLLSNPSRPGVQRTDNRMPSSLAGASAPNLMNLLQQSAGAQRTTAPNAQWPMPSIGISRALGSGLAGSPSSSKRPGVQRTSSRMMGGNKLANASAPNLLNIRRTASVPQDGRSGNAQWGQIPKASYRPQLGSGGRYTSSSNLRSGGQRTNSRMPTNTSTLVSAPNLMHPNLRRGRSVPEGGAGNARWGNSSPLASTFNPSEFASDGLNSTLIRAASNTRQARMASNQQGLSTPNLLNLARTSSEPVPQPQSAPWTANEAPTLARHPRMKSSNATVVTAGASAPNLRRSITAPVALSNNVKWSQPQSNSAAVGPTIPKTPLMRSLTSPNPSLPASRWDSASVFDVSSLRYMSTNTLAGERPKSPPNAGQLLRNHSRNNMSSRSRIGSSAPNLLTATRVYSIAEVGSHNADWKSTPTSRRNQKAMQSGENGTMGLSLETMLEYNYQNASASPNNRWENGSTGNLSGTSLQMDQWSTTKRIPKRRHSKSKSKKKRSSRGHHHHHHHHHHQHVGQEDGDAEPQLRRTDTDSSVTSEVHLSTELAGMICDAPPVPIKRTATDESVEIRGKTEGEEAMVDLVKEVTEIISAELKKHAASTEDSAAHAAVSLAALEITRSAQRVLRDERNNQNANPQKQHGCNLGTCPSCLGCSQTIPEDPCAQSDDSVDNVTLPDDEDTISNVPAEQSQHDCHNNNHHSQRTCQRDYCDKQMKAPVRCNSNRSKEHDSEDEMPLAQRKMGRPLRKPQRRASIDLEGVTSKDRSTNANRLPKRKPSIDSKQSQLNGTAMMQDSATAGSCAPFSKAHKDVTSITDCNDISMPNPGSSSHETSAPDKISYPGRLANPEKLELDCNPGGGLNPDLSSPSSCMSKAGSLGSLRAPGCLELMPDSGGSISKSSSVSSGLHGSFPKPSKPPAKLASLKARFGLADDRSTSKPSNAATKGSLTKKCDSSKTRSTEATSSIFGNITNEMFSMIAADVKPSTFQSATEERGPASKNDTNTGKQATADRNDEEEWPRTVTNAGCPTSEKQDDHSSECNDGFCISSTNRSKRANNATIGHALPPRQPSGSSSLRLLRDGAVI